MLINFPFLRGGCQYTPGVIFAQEFKILWADHSKDSSCIYLKFRWLKVALKEEVKTRVAVQQSDIKFL